MSTQTIVALEALRVEHPMPWYLEQDNDRGVIVNDSMGSCVFDCVPLERWASSHPEIVSKILRRSSALARFLIAMSNDPQP